MEYKITKEELGDDWLYYTIIALCQCMAKHGLPLFVVGARARDIAMKLLKCDMPKRRTEDLDVAIAIADWQSFDAISQTLTNNHFKRHGKTHKFFYKGEKNDIDYEVGIVPFGDVAEDEKICWPPEGNPIMSVRCFKDVMNKAVTVSITGNVDIKIAPLCGQFLIKLDTWNDRKDLTDKDAEDMLFILKHYFESQLFYKVDAVPPDVVTLDDDTQDELIWGMQWIAYDICNLLSSDHLKFYSSLIRDELSKKESSILILHSIKYYGSNDTDEICSYYESCRLLWSIFENILNNELIKREKR